VKIKFGATEGNPSVYVAAVAVQIIVREDELLAATEPKDLIALSARKRAQAVATLNDGLWSLTSALADLLNGISLFPLREAAKLDLGAAGRESDQQDAATPQELRIPAEETAHGAPAGGANPLPDARSRDSAGAASERFQPRRAVGFVGGSFARNGHHGADSDRLLHAYLAACDGPLMPSLIAAAEDVHTWMIDALERQLGVRPSFDQFRYRDAWWVRSPRVPSGALRIYDYNGYLAAQIVGFSE